MVDVPLSSAPEEGGGGCTARFLMLPGCNLMPSEPSRPPRAPPSEKSQLAGWEVKKNGDISESLPREYIYISIYSFLFYLFSYPLTSTVRDGDLPPFPPPSPTLWWPVPIFCGTKGPIFFTTRTKNPILYPQPPSKDLSTKKKEKSCAFIFQPPRLLFFSDSNKNPPPAVGANDRLLFINGVTVRM